MSRSYPIWTEVTACNYKSSKSFGSKNTSEQKIYVGAGKNHSHLLAKIITTKRVIDGIVYFKFSYNDNILNEIKMCEKTKKLL